MPKVSDIIAAIEAFAPASLQEKWDNTGLQTGHRDATVEGVLTCVDVTPERIVEALRRNANMIVSHHPLLFKGLKSITGENDTQLSVEMAVRNSIAVYSCHTSLDSTRGGVSHLIATRLGLTPARPLAPSGPGADTGLGAVCSPLTFSIDPRRFAESVKTTLGLDVIACSDPLKCPQEISTVAVCGGSGGEFIPQAIEAGAQAYITAEIRYHDFIDYARDILLLDCGHFETEVMTRNLLADIIRSRFPSLPVAESTNEKNPVTYI